MTDQTPQNSSLPPLGAVAPSGSTPPPPPPPRPSTPAEGAQAASSQPETAAASAPAVTTEASAVEPSGPRRSLLFGLVAALAIGGVVAGVLVGTGDSGESGDATTGVADIAEQPGAAATLAPVATDAPAATTVPTTAAPTTVAPTTTAAPTTTVAPTTTQAPTTTLPAPSFPVQPDGSPVPIVAIFDGPTVRVTGWVPSEEKAAQLEALALANSTDPNATIDSQLQIDPRVPLNIGTRVIEMNSPRFPAGSSDVTPEHATQLDRVAGVLNLLPNVSTTVVGHADQVGDAVSNYVLSEARAVSVVRYLVSQGIDPARLSARAVGEQDLLSEDESAASLALNRRTEFIFYGLIAD